MHTRNVLARWIATAMAIGMSACAAFDQTPYQPYSAWRGGGYTETEVQPGLFLVHFIGNQSTSAGRAADFALLRAADVCLQRGRTYMQVGGLATRSLQSGYLPGSSATTVVPTGADSPPTVTAETSPPTLLSSPESGLVVSCVETKQEGSWDAAYLARAVRAKYSLG
jgi:hypothetical protein